MFTKKTIILNKSQLDLLNESIEELEAHEVDLSSFDVQEGLNPYIWDGDKLNSRVRLKLLELADEFVDGLEVGWVKPKDIVFTGSLCGYTWSSFSDVDVHIVYDFSEIYPEQTEFVKDYFDAKKEEWNESHENLLIYGYPVEFYVEDANEKKGGTNRYSLESNEWLVKPVKIDDEIIDEDAIKEKVARIVTVIDDAEGKINSETDNYKIKQIGDKIYRLFKQLQVERAAGLASSKGEMSNGNIIYKACRRLGAFEKLFDIYNKSYDIYNSID